MARKKKKTDTDCSIQEFNEIEESCFSDDPPAGKCISHFSFGDNNSNKEVNNKPIELNITNNLNNQTTNTLPTNNSIKKIETQKDLFDNRRTPIANGAAPAIDGETPDVRRCYVLRSSTIRKINELKNVDDDINVCVSTIVDLAIDYYHNHIINKGEVQ